jgi:hypothetical protein|tara:strand:- start:706 stop:897 length:192 start_codon:yes stop_codon:yes gene_type:complete
MKAVIEFSYDDPQKSDEEIKAKLIEIIFENVEDWINGEGVIFIKFVDDDDVNALFWDMSKVQE